MLPCSFIGSTADPFRILEKQFKFELGNFPRTLDRSTANDSMKGDKPANQCVANFFPVSVVFEISKSSDMITKHFVRIVEEKLDQK